MKKTLTRIGLFSAIFVAIASYGGNMLLANAQSLTPAQTAALQQQLDVAKAQLVQLQMQEGQVPAGDNTLPGATATATVAPTTATAPSTATVTVVAPSDVTVTPTQTVSLSAADVTEMNTALTALAGVLVNLQTQIANNPQFIQTNGASVVATLKTIGNTVAVIGNQIESSGIAMTTPTQSSGAMNSGSGIAQANPSAAAPTTPTVTTQPSVTAPTAAVTPTTPATPAATTPTTQPTPAPTVAANPAPLSGTASSFSLGKLNWPLIIVIILIVAAIAIWLWWDDGADEKAKPAVRNISSQPSPQRPTVTVQTMNQQQGGSGQNQPSGQQTPLSAAMSNQQKKTA